MPLRRLRPEILTSSRVNLLTWPEEVFYRRLISVVDDFGRYDARHSILRTQCYPEGVERVRETDIARWLAACEKAGLIALYSANGKPFLVLFRCDPPRAHASKFPDPPADALRCAQLRPDVPYSYSSSNTSSSSSSAAVAAGRRNLKKSLKQKTLEMLEANPP